MVLSRTVNTYSQARRHLIANYCILCFIVTAFVFPFPVYASSFIITAKTQSLSDDNVIQIEASISGLKKDTQYFTQGAFTKTLDNPRYFGKTKSNNGIWNPYKSNPKDVNLAQFFYTLRTDDLGNALVLIDVSPDPEDQDYKGPGEYFIRLMRITTTGRSTYWSDNSIPIQLTIQVPTSTPSPSLKSPTPTPVSFTPTRSIVTKSPTPIQTKVSSRDPKPTSPITSISLSSNNESAQKPQATLELKKGENFASVAGELVESSELKGSPEPTISKFSHGRLLPPLLISFGGVLLVASSVLLGRRL